MARTRGWGGNPPADDEEARQRIIAAAKLCLDRYGPAKTTLADVAAELDISRPTVYRYFTTTDALITAAALHSSHEFMARVEQHLRHYTEPDELIAEALVWTLEHVPQDPYISILLEPARLTSTVTSIVDQTAFEFARSVLTHLDIDWSHLGLSNQQLGELAELLLRVLVSFLNFPDHTRDRDQLKQFFKTWIGGALPRESRALTPGTR